jgi:hypothetical protein
MKHNKLILSAGALLLTTAAVFAGRASTKFGQVTAAWVSTSGGCHEVSSSLPTSSIFTTGGSGTQAALKTVSGGSRPLWATNTCDEAGHTPHAIYFHPGN